MNEKKFNTIKVCHLVESAGSGTLSVIIDSINTLLNNEEGESKFEFTLIYSGTRAETPSNLDKLLPTCQLIDFPMSDSAFSADDPKAIAQLKEILIDFDVIHIHSSRAGFLGRLALFFIGKKNAPTSYYSPHCYGFENLSFSKLKRFFVYSIEKLLVLITSTTTIACGKTELKSALKLDSKATLVQNGFNNEHFQPVAKQPSDKVTILSSGRNCLQKDPAFFKKIMDNCNASNLKYIWLGNTDFENVSTGWIKREEALKHVSECSIFLATSLWEGLPISGIEAMFFKKPLIVRDTSSFVDLVDHGVNGFIFNTVDEAKKYIEILSADDKLRHKMGEESLIKASNEFHISNYKRFADLYQKSK